MTDKFLCSIIFSEKLFKNCESWIHTGTDIELSEQSSVASEKITRYLLKWQPENDKSEFLKRAGYTLDNWAFLLHDIRAQLKNEAVLSRKTPYGDMYKIHGELAGPNGILLKVITIWMTEYRSGKTKFITLFPDREV